MIEIFWYYATTLMFICVIIGLLCVYRYFLGNRLYEQSKKLRAEINRLPKDSLESLRNPSELISSGLGDIGIEGIMNELGIDSSILKNPLVKGLIDRYAPKLLEQLSKNNNKGVVNETQGF